MKPVQPPFLCPHPLRLALALVFLPMSAWSAVELAQQPLTIGTPVPPNILFIIDDSGSMNDDAMCAPGYSSCGTGVNSRTYTRNTLSYNPYVVYEPWYDADGNPMADADRTRVSTSNVNITGGTTNLTWANQDFYVPKNLTTGDTGDASLYRWRLEFGGSTAQRCEITILGIPFNCTNVAQFTWTRRDGSTITRSIAQEWQNYANWHHYYYGRMKMAKASVSRAFAGLGPNFRVGYRTINNNNTFDIPVGTDGGRFRGSNKSTFYTRLFATGTPGATPLRRALDDAGQYFSQTDAGGPYGPESGSAQITCRQNFTILTTDGAWNSSGASTTGAQTNTDGTDGPTITNPTTGQSYTYRAVFPYTDSRTNTLADVAMYYWKNDLRPLMDNNVPTSSSNPAFWQHMRTFGISIGEQGNVNPAGPYPAGGWPNPDNNARKIDDLLHASLNSRGRFIVAADPEAFTTAMISALDEITRETLTAASGGASSAKVDSSTRTFFTEYTSGAWNGTLLAFPLNASTGLQNLATPAWNAESVLPAWASRNIQFNRNGSISAFRHTSLTAAQQAALGANDSERERVVNYLRGDRSNERSISNPEGSMRERAGLLPAFINSQLIYVGPPSQTAYYGNSSFTSASSYANYAETNKNRTPVIYVAGNNGMLHAFRADTGVEIFAFLPNSAISETLKRYTHPRYGLNAPAESDYETYRHRYILDGETTAADVYINGAWRTVLVGTQGRGGTGVFALDITNPNSISLLWEKSATDNNAIGNNLGKPIIAQVAENDWRVILGNGPNSNGDRAQLIMLSIASGDITTVDTGVGSNNGLSGVQLWDSDKDGFFDTAYAGDLKGNLWRFTKLGSNLRQASRLFTTDSARPISAAPLVMSNQKTAATWVFFGTGRSLNDADMSDTSVQSWYGLIDNGTQIGARTNLVKRSIVSSGTLTGGRAARTLEKGTEAEITGTGKRGWYIDLLPPSGGGALPAGERMTTQNSLLGGALFATTFTPESVEVCSRGGYSSLWAINPFSGGRLDQGIFDINRDGVIDASDKLSDVYPSALDRIPVITSGQVPITSSGGGKFAIHLRNESIAGKLPAGVIGRQSWREIIGR